MTTAHLGHLGFTVDTAADGSHLTAAAEIERLGFGTLWILGGQLDTLARLTDLLAATEHATVVPAIIPPDRYDAATVVDFYQRADSLAPGRWLVGLGSPHGPRPLTALNAYVDSLEAAIPRDRRLLAALGPHALDIARDRFAGAVPMLVTPAYTASARDRLGADRVLAVGLFVVLDDDASAARASAREPLGFLTTLPAYVKSLRRQGFTSEEIAKLDDRLVDRLVAWGTPAEILCRAREHLAAGADHVQLTVLGGLGQPTGLPAARLLAAEMG